MQGAEGRNVEVVVDSSVVVEHEITKGVCALDGVWITFVEVEVFGVMLSYEGKGGGIGPELSQSQHFQSES